ncbi:cell division protein FtsQ/DivIB [Beijerinckia sp. L45]|uniref:cell division protein FtsQ/DivIB n=1 Tax=Beijerinckia sp. L45 TaxID=1641855 RepID=UPI001FED2EBD|nr:cell division protein FtsQ/DivIB [Beijerinckia sp. L45]
MTDFANALAPAPLALATDTQAFALNTRPRHEPRPAATVRPRRRRATITRLERLARSSYFGGSLVVVFFALIGGYAAVRSGAYAAYIETNGALYDQAAKTAGFAIHAVTINGAHELSENEVLTLAGVGPRNSLIFLNVADVRARLKSVPLIREASVSKLFPNRLLIEIEERKPYALWQKDGAVSIVSADGTTIDDMHDARFETLPLVTGVGANEKLADYIALLDAAGDLRSRIRAGIYVAGRRWTLKTNSGVEIVLPEKEPADALSRLALLEHDSHILEKDVLSLDLRIPGRVVARLSAEAGAVRDEALAKKTKTKGATT